MSTKTGVSSGQAPTKKATPKIPFIKKYADKNGFEINIANFDNPQICKRFGTIEVEIIHKTNRLEPLKKFSTAFDRELNIFYGVPLGIDNLTGEILWQSFFIKDYRTYDLTKREDAIEWAIFSRQAFLKGSPYAQGKPLYKMVNKEEEAQNVIITASTKRKAMEIAETGVPINEMLDLYRALGERGGESLSPTRLHAALVKYSRT